ncbi:hypothetical protein LXA43DRAFT_354613 [Ganoderma leucocontextum]|nr:hypothetical protein LXA43DRAFT_354613 [Ganoderma leucocontextum]
MPSQRRRRLTVATRSLLMILNATDLIFITYAIIRAASGISDSETDAMAAISVFRTFLPPVLVSRFLLDLQEAHQRKVVVLGSDSPLHTSSGSSSCDDRVSRSPTRSRVAFAPTLGALGATIDPADWDLLDDDDDDETHATSQAQATCGVHLAEDGSTQGPPVPEIRDECTSSLEGRRVFTG